MHDSCAFWHISMLRSPPLLACDGPNLTLKSCREVAANGIAPFNRAEQGLLSLAFKMARFNGKTCSFIFDTLTDSIKLWMNCTRQCFSISISNMTLTCPLRASVHSTWHCDDVKIARVKREKRQQLKTACRTGTVASVKVNATTAGDGRGSLRTLPFHTRRFQWHLMLTRGNYVYQAGKDRKWPRLKYPQWIQCQVSSHFKVLYDFDKMSDRRNPLNITWLIDR